MVEQQLPKLAATPENSRAISKTQTLTVVSFQLDAKSAAKRNRAGTAAPTASDPDHETCVEVTMADATPKEILPYLEGKIGELRKMRFWSKVDMRGPDECWEWQASLHTSGYGRFKIASYTTVMANRVSLVLHTSQDRLDRMALHTCDNRKCCNPHHLYWGTHQQNMQDKSDRGRWRGGNQAGANNGAAKITEDQLAVIISRIEQGWNNKQIAADMPIGHAMVSKIRLGQMWRPQTKSLGYTPRAQFKRKSA